MECNTKNIVGVESFKWVQVSEVDFFNCDVLQTKTIHFNLKYNPPYLDSLWVSFTKVHKVKGNMET